VTSSQPALVSSVRNTKDGVCGAVTHQNKEQFYKSYVENKLQSQINENKYSQTDFTPRLEQELVLGEYLETRLGTDLSELKVTKSELSRSEQNLSKAAKQTCSYFSLKKQRGPRYSEESLRCPRWESEVCYVRPNLKPSNSTELKVASQNPEIVMVDYGQEEII